jgi:hypothetical protein
MVCEEYRLNHGKPFLFVKCLEILNKMSKLSLDAFKEEHSGEIVLDDTEDSKPAVNTIGTPMGARLPRPMGSKKGK